MLILDKRHFKIKMIPEISKESISQEDITVINIYPLNNRAPKYMKQNC